MAKDVIMPVLGMNQETGTLVEWFKAEGDAVQKGEPLMVVATDKTEVEIEAMASGVLANVTAQPGDEVAVGSAIAVILVGGEAAPAKAAPTATVSTPVVERKAVPTDAKAPASVALPISPVAARIAAEHQVDLSCIKAKGDRIQKEDVLAHIAGQTPSEVSQSMGAPNGRILASPKARRLAQEEGLDLTTINGSGPDGAIVTEDIQQAAALVTPPAVSVLSSIEESHQSPVPMSRAWKVMAQRLQESWQTVPHFYLERTIDASALQEWRTRLQPRVAQKVTVTDLLTKVVAAALRQHPRVNASWIDGQIVLNADLNVGLAVAVEEGLLVPVVHHADQMGIGAIAERRVDVVTKAQAGNLGLAEMQGGTFTISNLGMFGITKFNAIVNPPQAAILAVGAIEERVVPVNGKAKVRPMMTLTLSCDHRVVDGARGAQFMQTLAGYLADPLSLLD